MSTLKQTLLSRFIQALNLIVMRIIYRISCFDADKLPAPGKGALLVCNHAAYLDACLILAALRRPVTFLIDRTIYQHPLVKPFVKASGVIPIEGGKNRRDVELALEEAAQRIAAGELVCIFAEGGITRLGILLPFRKGLERIMRDRTEPIIPLFLDGTWASVFGFKGGKFFLKRLSGWRIPVRLFVGDSLPSNTSSWQIRKQVQQLGMLAAASEKFCNRSLAQAFLDVSRTHRFKTAIIASDQRKISYAVLCDQVLSLADEIKHRAKNSRRIGIISDDASLTIIAHLAVAVSGKLAVVLSSSQQADSQNLNLDAIISPQEIAGEVVVIQQKPLLVDSTLGSCCAIIKSFLRRKSNRLEPDCEILSVAGVGLSSRNILRSAKDISELCHFNCDSQITVSGDFFSAVGIIANIWTPLLSGAVICLSSTTSEINAFVVSTNSADLSAAPGLFETLTIVGKSCGESELRKISFYGIGDSASLVLVQMPNFSDKDVKQIATKPETIGHPLLSVELKVVDPQSHGLIEAGNYGVLSLRGPSIAASVSNLQNSIFVPVSAAEDSDGFVSIKD